MLIEVTDSDVAKLAQIVREETGNQVQEKNYSMLASRIRSHVLKLGLDSMNQYWIHFKSHEKVERALLQSLMTTHYTFFFREFAHFEVLDNWITSELPRLKERFEKTKQPVRVWSAACSRGQEVYSLAMFLELNLAKKYGIPFEVVGTDIDVESVSFAKNGVYPLKEVNTIPQIYLKGFWKKGTGAIAAFAAIHPNLKSRTRFEPLNLLEIPSWTEKGKFDAVFCRNVFIYFSEANVQKIALDLASRLETHGLFVSGLSEPLRFKEWKLPSAGPSCYSNIPLSAVGPAPASLQSPAVPKPTLTVIPSAQADKAPAYRVLCVDDSKTIQTLIKNIFAQDPSCERVDFALNGREAREKLDTGKYDLITLDIHMPEVNGIEFLERLYKRKGDPPVLMVSSVNRTDLELATKSLSLGAFDYVEKPAMNNLQKSTDEILTKAKMALRSKEAISTVEIGGFDTSISQKIVVPDASQCLRVIATGKDSLLQLEQVIRGHGGEYRSPPTIVCWNASEALVNPAAELLKWTDRQIVELREPTQILKPNQIYVVDAKIISAILAGIRTKSMSLQVLSIPGSSLGSLKNIASLQVLLDEPLMGQKESFARNAGVGVSDVTPAISFPSLSVEFFANLRKGAA